MKRMTMKFMALALLTIAGAASVYAQGVAFTTTSLPRQMRQDGLTETAGEIQLTALTPGTVRAGSSIDVVFSVPITNNSSTSTNNISLANNVVCSASCPTSASIQGSNTVRLAFAADRVFAVNDTIVISRVRVNANAAVGVGSVTATMAGGSSDAVNNPITFTDPQRQVGVLNATITATVTASSLPNGGIPAIFRTCAFPNDGVDDLFIRITEVFPSALTSRTQEETLSNPPGNTVDNGSNVTITINGIPAGLTLAFTAFTQPTGGGSLAFDAPTPSTTVDQTVAGQPQSFTFTVNNSDLSLVERMTFQFSLKPTTTSSTTPLPVPAIGAPVTITATVSITPITNSDTTIVRFVANQIGPLTIGTVSDCTTRILMTWVATVADVETGVAINNTSSDDAAFGAGPLLGATSQNGTCTLTGYPSAGGTPVSFTTATINAGSSLAFLLSATTGFSNFTGYVLTVCNFEAAHAFTFITNGRGTVTGPTLAQGYVANIIQPGARPGIAGISESLGN